MPWVSEKKANHSTPVPLACLQMGTEQPSRGALRQQYDPSKRERQTRLLFPVWEQTTLNLDRYGACKGPQAPEETTPFSYTFPLVQEYADGFLSLHKDRERKLDTNRGSPSAASNSPPLNACVTGSHPSSTLPSTGGMGSQRHLCILKVWGKKSTPLSVSYVRIIFYESRWFVLIWIMQCLIFIFYQKKVAPYLQLLLGLSRVMKASDGNIYALSVKERWERLTHSTRNFQRERCVLRCAGFKAPDPRGPGAILNWHHLPRIPSELETPEHNLLS